MNYRMLYLLLVLSAAGAVHAQDRNLMVSEPRTALVIGNSSYKDAPLRNPVNDATDIAATLRSLGFAVTLRTNADTRQMRTVIREFAQNLKRGGVGLFYFAGHGIQSRNGKNYLVPVGADLKEEFELEDEAVDANRILAGMEEAGNRVNIVILDACRNNPFARSWRSATNGLAQMGAPTGSFVAFATAPGSVAADGMGRNGIFTQHLLANLKAGDPNIDQVFTRVTAAVATETGKKQVPWKSSSLTGNFYFALAAPSTTRTDAPAAAPGDPRADDRALWEAVKDSSNAAELQAYLEQFPNGIYAGVARARIKTLATAKPPVQVATALSSAASAPATQQRPSTLLLGSGILRAQSNYPSKDLRHTAFLDVMRDISTASAGAVNFEALPAGAVAPAFAVVDEVAKKTLAAAWISPTFIYGKDHAFGLVEGAPFGLDPGNYAAWRGNREVNVIVERLYRRYGVVGLACGVTAPHGDIWVKKPITKLDDLKGLKIRAVAMQIDMFTKVGAAVNALPGGEIVPAMDRGLLDAATYLDPRSDLTLGFSDVSKVYMLGQIHGARGLDFVINAAIWDSLNSDAQNAIATACRSNLNKMVSESTRIAAEAIHEMNSRYAVKTYKMPDSVLAGLRAAWNAVRSEEMAKNATFAELAATITAYDSAAPRPNLSAYGFVRTPEGRYVPP